MKLGIGFGSGTNKATTTGTSTTTSSSQSDPWSEAIPFLRNYLNQFGAAGAPGATPGQTAAFAELKGNAAAGNPWADEISGLTGDLFGAKDRSGMAEEAYGMLQGRLGDTAEGQYLDPMSNPEMAGMLKQVGDDVQNRINQMFAGAGRDLSGANQSAVSRGVTAAQLPLLLDQYNRERDRQTEAAGMLYGAGTGTATTLSNLDAARAGLRSSGIDAAQAALEAGDYGAARRLELEQSEKMLPYEDLGMLGSILFQVAGLGGQQSGTSNTTGTSTTKQKQTGYKIGL